MKKILVIYATAGDGHKKAAEAVYDALLEFRRPDIKVMPIDSLNYTNRFFKYCYKVGYMFMIKYAPTLWGICYHMLDKKFFYIFIRPLRRFINKLNTKKLVKLLLKEQFDLAISTHFMSTEVINRLKEEGILSLPLVNIITDFKAHRFWQAPKADIYTVASESTKESLIKRGINPDIIKVTGIPIRRGFREVIAKDKACQELGFSTGRLTILVMGGGFGVGPIQKVVKNLQNLELNCQVIVVCGHNKNLYNRIEAGRNNFSKPVYTVGFSSKIDKIMSCADIIITKVGGITVSEAFAKDLPIITIDPIPGQESNNALFLFSNNVGFEARNVKEVNTLIKNIFNSPQALQDIKDNIRRVARPDAATKIAELALCMLK